MENKTTYQSWEYETKCRRCGLIHDWHFSTVDETKDVDFWRQMHMYIESPNQYMCTACEKETVHDVVSYGKVKYG